jgi:hypothetical protein
MPAANPPAEAQHLADEIARRRGRRYPAHEYIATTFPDYMEVLTYGVTCMLEALDELKAEGWAPPSS